MALALVTCLALSPALASAFATSHAAARPLLHQRLAVHTTRAPRATAPASALRSNAAGKDLFASLPLTPFKPKHVPGVFTGKATFQPVPCNDLEEECLALCDEEECSVIAKTSLMQRLKVGAYFGLWFLLSVGYSVTNKKVTNILPLPWSVATATVVVGSIFVTGLWTTGARKPPRVSPAVVLTLLPIGVFHAIGHLAGTIGTAAGSVSFAQVVKAAGPVYACALSAIVLKHRVSRKVGLSLVPIVAGVALATLKELSFCWVALLGAVVSDLALALRNICSKLSMDKPKGENMTPANLFGVLTILSTFVSLPLAFMAERHVFAGAWASATAVMPAPALIGQIALTGLYFYGYSEVAMQALSNVHPVTHAIGNTLRRVVIMLVCAVVFRTPMTTLGMVGSAAAILGSYMYSMAKHEEKAQEKALAEKATPPEPIVVAPIQSGIPPVPVVTSDDASRQQAQSQS